MTIHITLREAKPGELDALEALVKAAYREFQPLFPENIWRAWMDNVGRTVHAAEGVALVAEVEGRLAGVVKFYADASRSAMGTWPPGAAMRVLAVHPDFRGRGIGTRLTEECLRQARKLNIRTVFLYTGEFMHAARHIYEKLGFKRVPELDRSPGPIAYRLDFKA